MCQPEKAGPPYPSTTNAYARADAGCGAGCTTVNKSLHPNTKAWGAEPDAWIHGYFEWDWADCYRKLVSAIPVTVNGTAYVNVSFQAQTHNDDNVDTHARL